jgi:hypothetical protein
VCPEIGAQPGGATQDHPLSSFDEKLSNVSQCNIDGAGVAGAD